MPLNSTRRQTGAPTFLLPNSEIVSTMTHTIGADDIVLAASRKDDMHAMANEFQE